MNVIFNTKHLHIFLRSALIGLCLLFLADTPAFAVAGTPALQAKLDALKARGLDYSAALAFWPLGDGEGFVSQAFGTLGASNADVLGTAVIDVQWVKASRLKGQACLEFAPPYSTVNGGGRRVLPRSLKSFTIESWCQPAWARGGGMIFHQDCISL